MSLGEWISASLLLLILFCAWAFLLYIISAALYRRYHRDATPRLEGGRVVWRCAKCQSIVETLGDTLWWCSVCERVCDKERL